MRAHYEQEIEEAVRTRAEQAEVEVGVAGRQVGRYACRHAAAYTGAYGQLSLSLGYGV